MTTKKKSVVGPIADQLARALREEHSLKLKLLDIDLGPQTPGALARNQEEAWKTLGRLRSINMDVKLPLLRELANYIHANRAVLEGIRTQRKKDKTKAEGTSRRP